MHNSIRTLVLAGFCLASSLASANYKPYPYGCSEMDAKKGTRWIYQYTGACSLRQHPDKIEECKKRVLGGESAHYDRLEKSLDTNCKNRNGYLRTSTCLSSHTFTSGEPAFANWHYQSATGYYCYYN